MANQQEITNKTHPKDPDKPENMTAAPDANAARVHKPGTPKKPDKR